MSLSAWELPLLGLILLPRFVAAAAQVPQHVATYQGCWRDLMLEMARPDPQDRPSANEVSSQGTDKAGSGKT